MEQRRPRGRETNVTGPAKKVEKRGQGLGTGPVGDTGGRGSGQSGAQDAGQRGTTRAGGAPKLIALVLALLLGGGGGLAALFGSSGGGDTQQPGQSSPPSQSAQVAQQPQTGGVDLSAILGSLGGGSVSSGWQGEANTGRLDTTVAPGARAKYTQVLGNGRDTFTIMVYMCGTDLESRSGMGTADLQEMISAKFGENVRLLVYTGGCSGWKNNLVSSSTNQIWQVKDGGLVRLQDGLGSVAMTDPSTLSGYIQWCARNFPASRYGLIFWDHGGGSISGYGYDEKFPRSGSMGLPGIDRALTDGGVKFDFIGYDACLMATAETALTMAKHGDYLIASEETEPGVGWYYTDWLTALGEDTSMPTVELGKRIVDGFVDTCAEKCRGQLTTLSVVDLAELEATVPSALTGFSRSASELIQNKDYQTVSNARSGAREFAQSSAIDQIDLVHLARNLGTKEGDALAEALLGAVKYNRTSTNMTNAYGISIYFPYQKAGNVDKAVSAYEQIGMDDDYARCIKQFASLEVSGQVAAGGSAAASPLGSLLGGLSGGGSSGGADAISQLLGGFLGGDFGRISGLDRDNTGFLQDQPMQTEALSDYLAQNRFVGEDLIWDRSGEVPVIRLSEEQWGLVHDLELNVFYDDGEGFIDLGLDNVFDFDDQGGLLGTADGSWLAIDGQPVAYYHTSTVDDGTHYTITGRVPVLHNGQRAELILTFTDEEPGGAVAGIQAVYPDGETATVAKADTALEPGDILEFLCDYYSYDGEYQDSYLLGEPLTVPEEGLTISNVPLDGTIRCTYRFTDIYHQYYWTAPFPQ